MAHYLVYWKPSTVVDNQHCPVMGHTASSQFEKLGIGDVLWIVTSEGPNDLVIVGRMRVDHIVGQLEAERILGVKNLWEAAYHAICDEPEEKINLDISRRAHELGFDGVVEYLPEGFTGQHLQAMRRLDYDSKNMLQRLWAQRAEAVDVHENE